jgi:hypothetical protein
MANSYVTLLDIAQLNGDSGVVPLIEKDIVIAPEVAKYPAMSIKGVSFDSVVRNTLPTTDYALTGNGIDSSKSGYEKKTFECKWRDGQMQVPKATALADARGKEHVLALEVDGMIKAAIRKIGRVAIYGTQTPGSTQGFPGALQVHDTTNMVVDATGTTDDVSTSVYGIKFGPEYMSLIFGNERVLSPGEWKEQMVLGANSKNMTAYVNSLDGWEGVSWQNPYCLGRIKKLTTDSGKGLTDSLIYDLFEKFLANLGELPDALLMTPRSQNQLRKSRTATTAKGDPAPLPMDVGGVPIIVTNSIVNTEKLAW